MRNLVPGACLVAIAIVASPSNQSKTSSISVQRLRDKIAGGWAGKMIGVSYGAPTEMRAQGKTYEEEIPWDPTQVKGALEQDDLYVQMTFMATMDRYGIDAPVFRFAESLANARYPLWHGNVQARKNYLDGILPPASGSPAYNLHADDIDFQIDADFIGLMCPGLSRTSGAICDKIGHIIGYGDGVYGGMFISALYAHAFFESDIATIISRALGAIPVESEYARCIRHVIELHARHPADWRAAWAELEARWGSVDICGALATYNIDAKLNGAYVVLALLYGGSDFGKTLEIAVRSGQDSDCNPATAGAVLGVVHGYSGIPEGWRSGIDLIADSKFASNDYTFHTIVDRTLEYATKLVARNGGAVNGDSVTVVLQQPVAPRLEVSFPKMVGAYSSTVFEPGGWKWTSGWQDLRGTKAGRTEVVSLARYAEAKGEEVSFTFDGSGIALEGNWTQDGGKADVYLDGKFHRRVDTYYWWAGEGMRHMTVWHAFNLPPGTHTVRLVVAGAKKPEATGTRIYLTSVRVFKPKE